MSAIRLLVGTRKGAFIINSDAGRKKWDINGPLFGGWEIYHMKGSTVDPNRIYASQTSGWFGQVLQRSDDGGKTWILPGTPTGQPTSPQGWPMGESNKFVYDTSAETGKPLTTHMFFDGTQHPWEFKRVWHLEPSLTERDVVYAGVEDAALFKSTDGGQTWKEVSGLRGHGTGPKWSPGAGGMGLHTILLDPKNPNRIYVAISAAGAFRTDDGGKNWKPINKGLRNDYLPDPAPEVGFCVHKMALHPSKPNTVYMQLHGGGGILRTDDAGDNWRSVNGNLPSDFGFPIDVHAHEPETIYCIPINQMPARTPPEAKLRVFRSKTGGDKWEPLTKGLPQENNYVNVLREAMAVDRLPSCGVYFGTTGGQVYCSTDSGDSWQTIVHDLPSVLSVEVQTLS